MHPPPAVVATSAMATLRHAAVLAALMCCIAQTGAYYLPGDSLGISPSGLWGGRAGPCLLSHFH